MQPIRLLKALDGQVYEVGKPQQGAPLKSKLTTIRAIRFDDSLHIYIIRDRAGGTRTYKAKDVDTSQIEYQA